MLTNDNVNETDEIAKHPIKPVQKYFRSYLKNIREVNYIFNHIPKVDTFLGQQNLLLAQELKSIYVLEYFKYVFYGVSSTFFLMQFDNKYKFLGRLKLPLIFLLPTSLSTI